MIRSRITINNRLGLHARASRKLAELALNYETTRILVRREDEEADAVLFVQLLDLVDVVPGIAHAGVGGNALDHHRPAPGAGPPA